MLKHSPQSPMGMTRAALIKYTKLNNGGGLSNALNELIQSGFCIEINPFSNNHTNTLYRLTDEYNFIFGLFIVPKKLHPGCRKQGNKVSNPGVGTLLRISA